MKKDRNTFFESVGFGSMNTNPNMMMPGAPAQISSNANFYAGPPLQGNMPNMGNIPNQGMHNPNVGMNMMSPDIDSRLAKMERQINRLETRVNKLEGDIGITPYQENDYNYSNSMYMV